VTFEPQQLEDDAFAADSANRGSNGQLLPIHPNAANGGGFGNSSYQQCPEFETADYYGCMVEEEFRSIPSEHYFDLTTRFNATDNLTFTASVQNMFNNQPKVVGNTLGQTTFNSGNIYPATYDALGRRYAVSAKLKF
jgi:outer membrane receptor protein involved in Fe transport